jgi:hypothetical protein
MSRRVLIIKMLNQIYSTRLTTDSKLCKCKKSLLWIEKALLPTDVQNCLPFSEENPSSFKRRYSLSKHIERDLNVLAVRLLFSSLRRLKAVSAWNRGIKSTHWSRSDNVCIRMKHVRCRRHGIRDEQKGRGLTAASRITVEQFVYLTSLGKNFSSIVTRFSHNFIQYILRMTASVV